MDAAIIANMVLGALNIGFIIYNVVENKRNAKFQRKLALYDRHLKIKVAIMSFMAKILENPSNASIDICGNLLRETRESEHLFNDEIKNYIMTLRNKALCLREVEISLSGQPVGDERTKIVGESKTIVDWFAKQFDEVDKLFADYLNLTKR